MMTNNEYVETTQYFGQDDHYGLMLDQIKDMEEIGQYTNFDQYQDFTDDTAIYPEDKGLEYTALGLASEAGEYAGKIKKIIRDGTGEGVQEALIAELGDVLWYVAQAAASLGVHMSEVAQMNVEKLKSRKERNVLSGSGDTR